MKQRKFRSTDPAEERRLNAMWPWIKSLIRVRPVLAYGALWNFVAMLLVDMNHVDLFAGLTVGCALSFFMAGYALNQLRKAWDSICPCPGCVAKREYEASLKRKK